MSSNTITALFVGFQLLIFGLIIVFILRTRNRSFQRITLLQTILILTSMVVFTGLEISLVNPTYNFAEARNAQRTADSMQLVTALGEYVFDHGGGKNLIPGVPLCPNYTYVGKAKNEVNLEELLVDNYIYSIPQDPSFGSATESGYAVCQTSNYRYVILAPHAENDKVISVKQ